MDEPARILNCSVLLESNRLPIMNQLLNQYLQDDLATTASHEKMNDAPVYHTLTSCSPSTSTEHSDCVSYPDFNSIASSSFNESSIISHEFGSFDAEFRFKKYQDEWEEYSQYYYQTKDNNEELVRQLEAELHADEKNSAEHQRIEEELSVLEEGLPSNVIHSLKKERQIISEKRAMLAKAQQAKSVFCCFICARAFVDEDAVRRHVAKAHLKDKTDYQFKCQQCPMRYKYRSNLSRHMNTHVEREQCSECDETFGDSIALAIHMSRVHSKSVEGDTLEDKEFTCDSCQKQFGIEDELRRHEYYCKRKVDIREKRKQDKEKIKLVYEPSWSVGADSNTTRTAVSEPSTSSTVESILSTVSSLSASSCSSLSGLSPSGRPVKDKSCPHCFMVFASMQSRQRHIQRKHPEKLDDPLTKQHTYLNTIYSPDLPFGCDVCGKRFTVKSAVSIHKRRLHSKEPSFQCTICGKGYPLASELRKHTTRVHEKEEKDKTNSCSDILF